MASNIAGEDEMEFDVNIQGKEGSKAEIIDVFLFCQYLFWIIGIVYSSILWTNKDMYLHVEISTC